MTTAFEFSPLYWKRFGDGSCLLEIEDLEIAYYCRAVEGGDLTGTMIVSSGGIEIERRYEEPFLVLIGQFMESL
jgi:hypothetical protein